MPDKHILLIMEIIDNIVSPDDRKRKYIDKHILEILVTLQIFKISYRSARIFLMNNEEYLRMIGIKEIPSFQILSRGARLFDMHEINSEITFLYLIESTAAIDYYMVHTCKHSTALRRRQYGRYTDPESGWSKTTGDGLMEGNAICPWMWIHLLLWTGRQQKETSMIPRPHMTRLTLLGIIPTFLQILLTIPQRYMIMSLKIHMPFL